MGRWRVGGEERLEKEERMLRFFFYFGKRCGYKLNKLIGKIKYKYWFKLEIIIRRIKLECMNLKK